MKKKKRMLTIDMMCLVEMLLSGECFSCPELSYLCEATGCAKNIRYLIDKFQVPIEMDSIEYWDDNKGEWNHFFGFRITPSKLETERERFGYTE